MEVKLLRENAQIPTQGSELAAGYDLYAALEKITMPDGTQDYGSIEIPPHCTVMIPTGIAVAVPQNCWAGIYARSGLATKSGLRPANCVGVIDPDYRGEIFVALHNDTNDYRYIQNGDRIAQMVFHIRLCATWTPVEELSSTERGVAGFGSTGMN